MISNHPVHPQITSTSAIIQQRLAAASSSSLKTPADTATAVPGLNTIGASFLSSSRSELERYVPPGETISDDAAKLYLKETFNTTSNNPVTLDVVRMRLQLMKELAIQEDLIFDMEREYNESVGSTGSHLGGSLVRGWVEGIVHPKKGIEALPKETKKFYTEAVKHNEHLFSFTSVTSRAYTLNPELAEFTAQRVIAGHSPGLSTDSPVAGPAGNPIPQSTPTSGGMIARKRLPATTIKEEKQSHKRKHESSVSVASASSPVEKSPSGVGVPVASFPLPDSKKETSEQQLQKRRVKKTGGEVNENPPLPDPTLIETSVEEAATLTQAAAEPKAVGVGKMTTGTAKPQISTPVVLPSFEPVLRPRAKQSPVVSPQGLTPDSSPAVHSNSPAVRRKAAKTKVLPSTPMSTRRSTISTPLAALGPGTELEQLPVPVTASGATKSAANRRRRTVDSVAESVADVPQPVTPTARKGQKKTKKAL